MHPQSAYHTVLHSLPDAQGMPLLAEKVFAQGFRREFDRPGFALLSLETPITSHALREFLFALKAALSECCRRTTGRSLVVFGLSRFDQQNSTRFHLDGGPEESYLLLGYEPSVVESALRMADYSKAAFDLGLTPEGYLSEHNPMFTSGERMLADYTTPVQGFDSRTAQVLLVNNSRLPFAPSYAHPLGVLHQATILTPQPDKSRVINSILLTSAAPDTGEPLADSVHQEFLRTEVISGEIQVSSQESDA